MDVYYNLFNEKAEEFFRDLIDGFPRTPQYELVISEFRTLKSGFALVKNMDLRTPQRVFKDYVLANYRDKILSKDESFFLSQEEFPITSRRKEYWMDFIGKIKEAWALMDDGTKDIIWKYFILLVFLSDKCDSKTI